MSASGWHPVTRRDPCQVCGGRDNCTRSDDLEFIWCGRVSEGSIKQNGGGQFLHKLADRLVQVAYPPGNRQFAVAPRSESRTEQHFSLRHWDKLANDAFTHPNAGLKRDELAIRLGVNIESLEQLGVGWLSHTCGWSIPERDATGRVIGISRRLLNGDKRREQGSQAGLTFDPRRWLEWEDNSHVYLIEGASDTAAMMTMKLSAVGRPSNLGGVELLGDLLTCVPADRKIVVVGERDYKPHELLPPARQKQHNVKCQCCSMCWPGQFGAIKTAKQLSAILQREIYWTLSPEESKDVRQWLNEQDRLEVMAEHGS